MMHKNYIRATAWERMRIDAMLKAGCIMTMVRRERGLLVPATGKIDVHHLVEGSKRLGHGWAIALHSWWHRGVPPRGMRAEEARALYGAALSDGRKAFRESHGFDDRDLFVETNKRMGMDTSFPVSKVFKRESLLPEALRLTTQE